MDGKGTDSKGNTIYASDFQFDEISLSQGKNGISAPYYGSSGRLQLTYQSPVIRDGKQVGAVYADRIVNDYNLPTLFTFHNGAGSAFVVDSDGKFIISSRGTGGEKDIFSYLGEQGNGDAVRETLPSYIKIKSPCWVSFL